MQRVGSEERDLRIDSLPLFLSLSRISGDSATLEKGRQRISSRRRRVLPYPHRRKMALSQVSASLAFSYPNSGAIKLATITNPISTCRVHVPKLAGIRSTFASGSPLCTSSLVLTNSPIL
ncbi:hypothetical protein ISN44_As06g039290 [Arabidopsis suecica]|uniref:Uncharacterized protein n=2 Tax=Arabidopsis suecica TaxID=45249 RepID=A0A8T2CJV0_ARASU|nr:hypothetical protein ISN44_As06g039290 [Arabidopsis suecica]KAG7599753.1 hypothetical protein ISN44_As06g039290 [Arabidopsis suecica]KAG7599754.1 hypothetical protein ISN44_As06g039290 [Arabidopsis suecica]KAG7599755.1 hypothetical protein ISN44_As06g039290 [Arabidopsis suecica]